MKLMILSFLILAACSFKKGPLENQSPSGHEELYSSPDAPKNNVPKGLKRIVIAATNDIHGHYWPHSLTFKDKHNPEKQSIGIGGVHYISSYFKILRQHYGEVLLIDSGDIFSHKVEQQNFVQDFYSSLKYDALSIGMNDFNLKLPEKYKNTSEFIKDFAKKSKTPLVLSNLYELKTARGIEWQGTLPYILKEVNGVKIGVIGLIPDDMVEQTPIDNRVGLYVESMIHSTLRLSRLLRSLGADLVVVMTHQGLNCGSGMAQELKLPLSKVNFEPEKSDVCDLSSKLGMYLNRLPPNLVDVVVAGRNHQKTVNFVNTTLVISNFPDGQSFTYAEFFIDAKTKKIEADKTVAHQPVMICHEFFKETNDCYSEDPTIDHKTRTPAKFLGHAIEADRSLEKKFLHFMQPNSVSQKSLLKGVHSTLDFHRGSISFSRNNSGNSKLIMLEVTGSELIQMLENDYNQGLAQNWRPSPFRLIDHNLYLTIQGSVIEPTASYKVLADLDDSQEHGVLKKLISRPGNKTLNHFSWNEPVSSSDAVSTTMAVSDTVR